MAITITVVADVVHGSFLMETVPIDIYDIYVCRGRGEKEKVDKAVFVSLRCCCLFSPLFFYLCMFCPCF